MKSKFLYVILLVNISIFSLYGQNVDVPEEVVNHCKQKAVEWGLTKADVNNLEISSEVRSEEGIKYLYINQTYKNIPIRNALMTIVIDKYGKIVSDANSFISDIESKVQTTTPTITSEMAILQSAVHFDIRLKTQPQVSNRSVSGLSTYTFPEYTNSPIETRLMFEVVGNSLKLVWNLTLDMASTSDYWDFNVDATSGGFISKHNYTVYCQHHLGTYAHHDQCSDIKSFRKIDSNLGSPSNFISSAAASYKVYSLPTESPNHGGRSTVFDDQYPMASPFGWHDTNGVQGPEFTTTKGNNVDAYEDKNDDNVTDGGEPNGGTNLNFDYPIDLNNDPRQSNLASVTNLFYMVNMMHNISYMTGFTEEFGNFQAKNYTGKGSENDFVQAQAFDGITKHEAKLDIVDGSPTKINNANFSAPPDGSNGRMQMFFWNNEGGSVSIDSPESIRGFVVDYGIGRFGKVIPANNELAITGQIALVRNGSSNPTSGCSIATNSNEVQGKIGLVDRGICDFSQKVYLAQQAGAIAVIVCNLSGINGGNGEELIDMGAAQNAGLVTIPSVFFKKSDCDKIRVVLAIGGSVTLTLQERERQGAAYLDGSLDNGIIAHEFAHGISIRLTGGRQNSSCLNNNEQMGEGWSDFFSLAVTHKPGDKGSDKRGMATYASAQQTTGGGIRRFPYSTDMSINPQTYNSIIGTSSEHQLGEVWADMLWDMYWAMVEKYGYNPDLKVKTSGNYKALFLVMEGLKMQPCNPGFIQGRDAIFKADELHFAGENKCLLWTVFARRGLGFSANGGSTTDRNDGTENFDVLPTCIEKLKISKTVSSSVFPGSDVSVELKAINHVPSRQNNVIITDELENGLTYVAGSSPIAPTIVGNTLIFDAGNMDFGSEININYKVKSKIENKSIRQFLENLDQDINWEISKNVGVEDWVPNNDIYRSPFASVSIINVAAATDASIKTQKYQISGKNPTLRFWHRYNTQTGNDGGFVEISVNGGPFTFVTKDKFIRNGYTGPLAYGTLAIPSLQAFYGNSGGNWGGGSIVGPWIDSYIDLTSYLGQNVEFRFRFANDATVKAVGDLTGWFIDDFEIIDIFKYNTQACIAADGGQSVKACTPTLQTLVNTQEGLSTNEKVANDIFTMTMYPNPADDYVSIEFTSPIDISGTLKMVHIDGTIMGKYLVDLNNSKRSYTIDTSSLPSGIYLVSLTSGDYTVVKKLVKQ